MRYGMVIDLKRCSGCKTCSVVCKVANNIPNDIIWNRVLTEGGNAPDTGWWAPGTIPRCSTGPWPASTARTPACTKVVPGGRHVEGTSRRALCARTTTSASAAACAWPPAPTRVSARSTGRSRPTTPTSPWATPMPPSTRSTRWRSASSAPSAWPAASSRPGAADCIGRARHFGDLDDPNSEVSKLLASREYTRCTPNSAPSPLSTISFRKGDTPMTMRKEAGRPTAG